MRKTSPLAKSENSCPDRAFINGVVRTMDVGDTVAEAVSWRDGRIVAVGKNEEVLNGCSRWTEVHDLGGLTVLPGFIDPHQHYGDVASIEDGENFDSDTGVRSIREIQQRLAKYATDQPAEETWVKGFQYDEYDLEDGRHPTRRDLDKAVRDRPVFLQHISWHVAVLNSCAMKRLGLDDDTRARPASEYGRDPSTDRLNGQLFGSALQTVRGKVLPLKTERLCNYMRNIGERYWKNGITSVCDMLTVSSAKAAYLALWNQRRLPVRVTAYLPYWEYKGPIENVFADLPRDSWLKFAGIKHFIDGGMSSGTAAVSDAPGYSHPVMRLSSSQVRDFLDSVHSAGLQASVHANGDIAVSRFLDALECVLSSKPRTDHRHRIEHCSVIDDDIMERIARTGALPSLAATMPWSHGERIKRYICDPSREGSLFPFRTMLDRGIPVSAHSDHPTNSLAPLQGIHSQVCRVTKRHGLPIGQEQAITVSDALRTWTINAAYATFDESLKGSIQRGKVADLIILDRDPVTIEPSELATLTVIETVLDGETVFSKRV